MVAHDWDALQSSFLDQVAKLAELAVSDQVLEQNIAASRQERQVCISILGVAEIRPPCSLVLMSPFLWS